MDKMNYDESDLTSVQEYSAKNGLAFNEDQSVFLARQLEYVRSRVYETKRPPMSALSFIPVTSEAPEWADTVITRTFDAVGMAKIISNYADDLPRADVAGSERAVRVKDIGVSYGYNVAEVRSASAPGGTNLPERKGNAARRAVEKKLNQIAMIGDPQYGLFGLLNHPNIGVTTGLTGNWSAGATTALQIVTDVDILVDAVVNQSGGVHYPNLLVLPQAALSAMGRKYMADTGGKSAFDIVRNKYPDMRILGIPEFNAGQAAVTSTVVIGEFTEENLYLDVPMAFNQLPAQARNLEWVVDCLARSAGLAVEYPLALTRASGV